MLYLGTQTFFAENVTGGLRTVQAELPEGRLRDFIGQRFLPGSLYEVMVVPTLIEAEARALGQPLDRYLTFRTRWQAKRDIGGVYRLLLKLTSPELVAARLPKVVVQMFNFATTTHRDLGDKHVQLEVRGVPQALAAWLEVGFKVYVETALTLAGARHPELSLMRQEASGSREGFPLVTLQGDVRWS